MSRIDVLPQALAASGRAVRQLVADVEPVHAEELGEPGLSAAHAAYVAAWSGAAVVDAAEECALALEAAARTYGQVEALLVPRALR